MKCAVVPMVTFREEISSNRQQREEMHKEQVPLQQAGPKFSALLCLRLVLYLRSLSTSAG